MAICTNSLEWDFLREYDDNPEDMPTTGKKLLAAFENMRKYSEETAYSLNEKKTYIFTVICTLKTCFPSIGTRECDFYNSRYTYVVCESGGYIYFHYNGGWRGQFNTRFKVE